MARHRFNRAIAWPRCSGLRRSYWSEPFLNRSRIRHAEGIRCRDGHRGGEKGKSQGTISYLYYICVCEQGRKQGGNDYIDIEVHGPLVPRNDWSRWILDNRLLLFRLCRSLAIVVTAWFPTRPMLPPSSTVMHQYCVHCPLCTHMTFHEQRLMYDYKADLHAHLHTHVIVSAGHFGRPKCNLRNRSCAPLVVSRWLPFLDSFISLVAIHSPSWRTWRCQVGVIFSSSNAACRGPRMSTHPAYPRHSDLESEEGHKVVQTVVTHIERMFLMNTFDFCFICLNLAGYVHL